MHIANYRGLLYSYRSDHLWHASRNASFEIVLEIRCFYAKHVNVYKIGPFLG